MHSLRTGSSLVVGQKRSDEAPPLSGHQSIPISSEHPEALGTDELQACDGELLSR